MKLFLTAHLAQDIKQLQLHLANILRSIPHPTDHTEAAVYAPTNRAYFFGSSLNSVGKGITIYHNPRSNKSLCPSLRKNSSG